MLNIPSSVKALFQADCVHKNFRVHFPNGEMADITNDNVVQESVKFTESLCSQSTFKFGLAEASVLEFETVGIANMYGMTIEASVEIDCSSLSAADKATIAAGTWDGTWDAVNEVFAVPYGVFRVESCPRDHQSMAHRKVTAYSVGINKTNAIRMQEATLNRYTQYIYHDLNPQDIFAATSAGPSSDLSSFGYTSTDFTFPRSETIGSNGPNFYLWWGLDGNLMKYAALRLKQGTVIKSEGFGEPYSTPSLTEGVVVFNYDEKALDAQMDTLLASMHQKYDSRANSYGESTANAGLKLVYPRMEFGFYFHKVGSGDSRNDQGPDTVLKFSDNAPVAPFDGIAPLPSGYETVETYSTIYCIPNSFIIEEVVSQGGNIIETIDHQITVGQITAKRWTAVSDMGIRLRIAPTLKGRYYYTDYFNSFTNAVNFLDVLQGYIELNANFAKANRLGGYEQIRLDNSSPQLIIPNDYSEAWWDEYDVDPIGTVTITYKNGDDEETAEIRIGDGQSKYDMTGNEVLQKLDDVTYNSLVSDINTYFAPHTNTVAFTPIELTMQGWPWMEAGDALQITAEDGTVVETYALRVEMSGIQHLTATITAEGGEIIEEVE